MKRPSGALRIFRYNWLIYLATWTAAAASLTAAVCLGRLASPSPIAHLASPILAAGGGLALLWSAGSLLVSAYIYDRSELVGGAWLAALLPARTATWATIDAGLDAEVLLDEVMPGACVARLDIYDPAAMSAESIRRARQVTPRARAAEPSPPGALVTATASCDVVTVVFSAHELRGRALREQFFREVGRTLRPGGRLVLVEHVRDLANFVAFGPGFVHFLPRAEWLRLADLTGLRVVVERRVTPWVVAFAMEEAVAA